MDVIIVLIWNWESERYVKQYMKGTGHNLIAFITNKMMDKIIHKTEPQWEQGPNMFFTSSKTEINF